MSEQENKRRSIYDLLNTKIKLKSTVYKIKKTSFTEKELFKGKGE